MDWGKRNRLARLRRADGHCFFLPIDHGYFWGRPESWTNLEKRSKTCYSSATACFAPGVSYARA